MKATASKIITTLVPEPNEYNTKLYCLVSSLVGNVIQRSGWSLNITDTLLKSEFSDNIFSVITQPSDGKYTLYVSNYTNSTSLKGRTFINPTAFTFKEYSSDRIQTYYSTSSSTGGFLLKRELMDLNLNSLSSKEINIGDNCANLITITSDLIILVCTTTSPRIMSVYRDSDMLLLFNKNDDATMLATTVRALSTSYYYQLVYNSYSSTTTNGTLSFVDILTDRHNANITTNIVRANEMADTDFIGYGQYFDVDSDGMAYISAHSDYNTTQVNPINTVRLCTHNQKYNSSTKTCTSISSSTITFSLQDTFEVACSSVNNSNTYMKTVTESVCL